MGQEAAAAALKDARIGYSQVQAVVASYCYGDPTCGRLLASITPSLSLCTLLDGESMEIKN